MIPIFAFLAVAFGLSKRAKANEGGGSAPSTPATPATPKSPFLGLDEDEIPRYISSFEVYNLALKVRADYNLLPSAKLITTIATIESGDHRNPNRHDRLGKRYEPHINDTSYGIMQTLYRDCAKWLYDVKGYRGRKLGSPERLYSPLTSIYFGAAYIDWLMRAYGGTEEQIARRYNGGPRGEKVAQTAAYWEKYKIAKANLIEKNVFA